MTGVQTCALPIFVAPLADDTARALVAAALGVVVAVANQAIIGRCMTRRAQPAPEPVPLG